MPFQITELSLEEISAVPAGANRGARVVLLKAAGGHGEVDASERVSIMKRLARYLGVGRETAGGELVIEKTNDEGDDTVDEKVKKQIDDLTAEVKKLTDARVVDAQKITELVQKLGEGKDAAAQKFREGLPQAFQKAFDEMSPEDKKRMMDEAAEDEDKDKKPNPFAKVLKAVTQVNEVLAAQVEKLIKTQEAQAVEKELAGLEGIVDVGELAPEYQKLRKAAPEAAVALLAQLKKVATQAREGGLFKTLGRDGGAAPGGAEEKIEKAVTEYRKVHPGATEAAAWDAVMKAEPMLYDEYNAEKEGK